VALAIDRPSKIVCAGLNHRPHADESTSASSPIPSSAKTVNASACIGEVDAK
jgi:hypothetical protein